MVSSELSFQLHKQPITIDFVIFLYLNDNWFYVTTLKVGYDNWKNPSFVVRRWPFAAFVLRYGHMDEECSSDDEHVIDTPSLKYFKVNDNRESFSFLIELMPNLEEADINVREDIRCFLNQWPLSNAFRFAQASVMKR